MNPINLTLDVPITGNCDNLNCCFPSIPKRKSKKNKQDEKIHEIAKNLNVKK